MRYIASMPRELYSTLIYKTTALKGRDRSACGVELFCGGGYNKETAGEYLRRVGGIFEPDGGDSSQERARGGAASNGKGTHPLERRERREVVAGVR